MIKTLTFNINFPFTGKTKATITVAFCISVPLNPSKTSFQNDIQPSCFKFGDSKNGMQILRRHMRVKDGRQNNGRQRYKCKSCHRKQQALYSYNAYQKGINNAIITLTKRESVFEVQHEYWISLLQPYSAELYRLPRQSLVRRSLLKGLMKWMK